ncbi:hypothetical protein SK128_019469, partial [Halocaridina rubra]
MRQRLLGTPNVMVTQDNRGDVLKLLKFLQESEQRWLYQDEIRRKADDLQHWEEYERFTRLLQIMSHMWSGTATPPTQAVHNYPITPTDTPVPSETKSTP